MWSLLVVVGSVLGLGLLCMLCGTVALAGGWALARMFDVSVGQGAMVVLGSGAVLALWSSFSQLIDSTSRIARQSPPRSQVADHEDASRADIPDWAARASSVSKRVSRRSGSAAGPR
jgi:hypothetical protein